MEYRMPLFGMRVLYEVSVKDFFFHFESKCIFAHLWLIRDRPLETAQENYHRLGGADALGNQLPYPECCPVTKTKHLHTKCPNCPTQYCSVECLKWVTQALFDCDCSLYDFVFIALVVKPINGTTPFYAWDLNMQTPIIPPMLLMKHGSE